MLVNKLNRKKLAYLSVASWATLFVFLASSQPQNLSATVLMLPATILFLSIFFSVLTIIDLLNLHSVIKYSEVSFSLIIALVPTALLMLKSINQLTPKDVILFGVIAVVGATYAKRFRIAPKIN